MVQIESRAGLGAVDAIAAVDGVDGVFVGPSDLAAAMGHLGNAAHPDVQQAIRHIFERARAAGKASGILAPVEADARRYLEWGVDFIAVGSDLGLFRTATPGLARQVRAVELSGRAAAFAAASPEPTCSSGVRRRSSPAASRRVPSEPVRA